MRCVTQVDLVEVQAVSFGYARTTLEEECPRCIVNAFAEVLVFHHVRGSQCFGDDNAVVFVVKQLVDKLADKVMSLVSRAFVMARQRVCRLLSPPTLFLSAR